MEIENAIIRDLGLNQGDADNLRWDTDYIDPIFSITGNKNEGIKCNPHNCIDTIKRRLNVVYQESEVASPKAASPTKTCNQFSAQKYRKDKCPNIDELHSLQNYVISELMSALADAPEEVRAHARKKLEVKFKRQERKYLKRDIPEEDTINVVAVNDGASDVSNTVDDNTILTAAKTKPCVVTEPITDNVQLANNDTTPTTQLENLVITYNNAPHLVTYTRATGSVYHGVTAHHAPGIFAFPAIAVMGYIPGRGPPMIAS